ncbi:BspA family leucine-rich repeat surface protein [Enterococcus mundtii]|uniref:BspA family leucine-rich repeat surface protein n=1 Tax=Enterococcus mundtii TaxID=53346 RepID=A0A848N0R5_ENTMU|nr:BspA family leucine-rich repeat surface protein [Enterococcus mundtii]NMP59750.1 BspA family leucine-rich repeat surface protein [Enterococcus mundtii]
MKIKKALVLISTCLLCFPLLFSPVIATSVPVFAIENPVELTKEAELLDPLTYTHDYSSFSDNHEVTATSEYPEKQEESEKNESEEVSNRATEYRLELVASPPAGGNPRRIDSSGSNVVWLRVGDNLGNMRAFPNPGYRFLHWEVASGPIFIFSPNSEDLSVSQREPGNSVIRAVFEPVQGGNVTVKHEDEAGNQLADSSVLTGLVDQTYTTEALSISGWQLSKIPENASGTFGVEEQTVVYTYEPEQNLWGTVPWSYEEGTETITLYGGEAGARGDAPWKTYSSVKQIIVEDQVILPSNSTALFWALPNLESIDNAGRFDTSNVTNMHNMFGGTNNIKTLDLSNWDTSKVTDMAFMFNLNRNLETLNVSNWDTSNVTSMRAMFQATESLTVIDASNWDTSSVTLMRYMFSGARNLETLNVSNWDTSNVTDMEAMFQNAESLTAIDVSSWNTSNVTSMRFTFNGASNLETLNVSNWNTSNVTDMRAMFQNAESLTAIDVSSWNTSNVTDMGWMFNGARNLETLNLSNWNTTNVSVATSMFSNTTNLSELHLGTRSRFDHLASPPTMPTITSSDNYTGSWVYYLNQANTIPEIYIASSPVNFWREYDGSNPGTYQWQKKGSVAVHYRDINDQEIIASEIITGGIREPFQIEEKAIEGYTLQEISDNTSGRFTEVEQAVIFRYMKNTVDPVDPLNPEIEVYPENKPDLPEDQGLLSIDFVSSFNFGSQAISIHEQTYYAQPQRLLNEDGAVNENEVRPNYVQISDRRPESERNGWELAVTQQEQFKGKENQVLNGASITLLNQQVVTAQGGTAPELQSVHPLIPGNRQRLLKAQGSEGMGTWIYRFGDADTAEESVTLNVPKGANPEATTYSTKLTWELSRVPDN